MVSPWVKDREALDNVEGKQELLEVEMGEDKVDKEFKMEPNEVSNILQMLEILLPVDFLFLNHLQTWLLNHLTLMSLLLSSQSPLLLPLILMIANNYWEKLCFP